MKAPLLALFLALLAASAIAANVVTRKGEVLLDAKVSRVEANGVGFTHSNGSAFVDFDDLPSDLQKQYGWTAEKSAARQQARAKADKDAKEAAEAAERAKLAANLKRMQQAYDEKAKRDAEHAAIERERQSKEQWQSAGQWGLRIFVWCAAAFLYFLPAIVGRHKRNAQAIAVLNILAGWTFVGWVIALVWAASKDQQPQQMVVTQIRHAPPPQAKPVAQPRPIAQAQPPRPVARSPKTE